MEMSMMLMMIMSMNTMMMYMKHPMSMGLTLIIQTIMIALMSGMMMKTFWMSYILLITMLSGMLVLFIYMSSIASNEKFINSMKMSMFFMVSLMISMFMLFMEKNIVMMFNMDILENSKNKYMNMFMLNKMFNNEHMYITMTVILFLLMTMIVSTNIVKIDQGPMRMKTYE